METETISIAFSSEVDTGSYQKNTSNKVATFGRALALPHAEYPQINDLSVSFPRRWNDLERRTVIVPSLSPALEDRRSNEGFPVRAELNGCEDSAPFNFGRPFHFFAREANVQGFPHVRRY